jgi:hypothetical protein
MKTIVERNTRALIILLAGLLICGSAMGAKRHEPRRLPESTAKLEQPLSHLDDTDSLYWDNNIPWYFFSFPDPDGDSLFNVRFQAPDSCGLLGVWIMFYMDPDSFLTAPNFATLVWNMGPDSFPAEVLSSDTFDWDDITAFHPDWYYVDLSHHNHTFDAEQWFHIGLTGIDYEPGDTVAFITDDGNPSTPYTSFKWEGQWWKMDDMYPAGYNAFFRAIVEVEGSGVQILEPGPIPTAFHLDTPYPNPFNPTATLRFSIINSQPMKLTVTDILGRTVATLAEGSMTPGTYRITVDGSLWSSGIYFAHLVQGQNARSAKLMLVK